MTIKKREKEIPTDKKRFKKILIKKKESHG